MIKLFNLDPIVLFQLYKIIKKWMKLLKILILLKTKIHNGLFSIMDIILIVINYWCF